MKVDPLKHVALALVIFVSVISCNNSSNVAEGGIGGSGVSMGSVSAIGSIWVNGVEYDTTGATIFLVDEGLQEIDANGTAGGNTVFPGMVVTVKGTVNTDGVTGTATSVSYADILEGPITAVPNPNTIVVLGQNIIIDNLTKDKNGAVLNGSSAFAVEQWVEVSGFVDANANIHATYIENREASTEVELKGIVTILDSSHIAIGGLTIVADSAGLANGDFVEVKGLYNNLTGNTLVADSVKHLPPTLSAEDYDEAEMEGIVTSVTVPETAFFLGTQYVELGSEVEFNGGLPIDIAPGVKLEVEGRFTAGVLIAREISFEDGIELEANIGAINSNTQTVTLDGLVTSDGSKLEVEVDDVLTDLEGAGQFSDLLVGNHLQIRARNTGAGLLAIKLVVSNAVPENTIMLQAPLEAKVESANEVRVLGVDASGFVAYEIEHTGGVDAATFFGSVSVNDLVDLRGQWDGYNLTWESIELDD